MNHLLSIESLDVASIEDLLGLAFRLKSQRGKRGQRAPLRDQSWGLIFGKSSTRTRVSFEVAVRELGGRALFLGRQDIQLGRGESVEDTARVLSRYLHGVVIRTFAQREVETFAQVGTVPVVNALTDDEHPCQILADLMTWAEDLRQRARRKPKKITDLFKGKTLAFFGDAACNVAQSWIFASVKLGFTIRLAAPRQFQPSAELLARAHLPRNICFTDAHNAARHADLLYTDTWVSMGKEEESRDRLALLAPYQINTRIVEAANPGALVMHCLPAYRGQEITAVVFESHAKTIFDEVENRLHLQKAVLTRLAESR